MHRKLIYLLEVGWLALFTSTGTLICCALPILLATLGFGAVVASFTCRFPVLVTLSEYDGWMFGVSADLLGLTTWVIWGHEVQCPADPILDAVIEVNGRWLEGENMVHQVTGGLQRIHRNWMLEGGVVQDLNSPDDTRIIFGARFHF